MNENTKAGVFDKLDNIIIRVKDIKAAKEWYDRILEFKQVFFDENEKLVVYSTGTDAGLTIWQIKDGEEFYPAKITGSYPIFFSDNLDKVHLLLKERNVKVEEIQGSKFLKFFGFFDIDGNRLEVCKYSN